MGIEHAPPVLHAPDVTLGHVTCESLSVRSPASDVRVDIEVGKGASGIWISKGGGTPCMCLIEQPGVGFYLGFHGRDVSQERGSGCPLALTLDETGEPYLQVGRGGDVKSVSLRQLAAVLNL